MEDQNEDKSVNFTLKGKSFSITNFKEQVKPLESFVLIRKISIKKPVEGKILLLSTSPDNSKIHLGVVVAVGSKVGESIKVDSFVVFNKWSGQELGYTEYVIVKYEEIKATLVVN